MGKTMTVAAVWAGDDLYRLVHFPADLQGQPAAIEQEVRKQLMSDLTEEFGEGVDLTPDPEPQVFRINVDNVRVSA